MNEIKLNGKRYHVIQAGEVLGTDGVLRGPDGAVVPGPCIDPIKAAAYASAAALQAKPVPRKGVKADG